MTIYLPYTRKNYIIIVINCQCGTITNWYLFHSAGPISEKETVTNVLTVLEGDRKVCSNQRT